MHVWKTVFSKPRSWILLIAISFIFFSLNVALKNYRALYDLARLNGIETSLTFFGTLLTGFYATVTPPSYFSLIIISLMIGFVVSLGMFKASALRTTNAGFSSTVGVLLGVIAPGCAACGAGLAALVGLTGATLAALPLKGYEFSLLAIALLGLSIHNLTQGLRVCKACQVQLAKVAERRSTHNGRKE